MRLIFSERSWSDYQHWVSTDRDILDRLNRLIEEVRRTPFTGLGKPEPLKGEFAGWWSRRITGEHRMIYRVTGRRGEDRRREIAQCRHHY